MRSVEILFKICQYTDIKIIRRSADIDYVGHMEGRKRIRYKVIKRMTVWLLTAAILFVQISVRPYAAESTGTDTIYGDISSNGSVSSSESFVSVDTASDNGYAADSDDSISDNEAEDDTVIASVVIDEAHGEPIESLSRRRLFSSSQSDPDYYYKYYNQLSDFGKEVYDLLLSHAEDFLDPATVVTLDYNGGEPVDDVQTAANQATSDIRYAVAAFDYDHPEIFWLDISAFQWDLHSKTKTSGGVTQKTVYAEFDRRHTTEDGVKTYSTDDYIIYDSADEVAADKAESEENIDNILSMIPEGYGIYRSLGIANDWLADNNYYNRYVSKGLNSEAGDKTWKSSAALTAQPWLTSSSDYGDKDAPVCEGYARAFKIICDRIGVPCVLAVGDNHMWDYVQASDGNWYAVDVTRDDPVRSDEWKNRATPEDSIRKYLMVGNDTVVEGRTQTFYEDGHHPNGTFWTGGTVMPTPTISSEAYKLVYPIDTIFEEDGYKYYSKNGESLYTGVLEQKIGDAKKYYYFCTEDDRNWEEYTDSIPAGAMATGLVWLKWDLTTGVQRDDYRNLYRLYDDGSYELLRRIAAVSINDIPESAEQALAVNVLKRGSAYRLKAELLPEDPLGRGYGTEDITESTAIEWTSGDSSVVSVDSDGTIHARSISSEPVVITAVAGDRENDSKSRTEESVTASIAIRTSYPQGWFEVEDKKYYGLSRNEATGTVTLAEGRTDIDGSTYYFYPSDDTVNTPYTMACGIVRLDGRYYDFGEDGRLIGGSGSADGAVSDGLITYEGKTYYAEDGVIVSSAAVRSSGSRYYGFDPDGVMYKGTYFKYEDNYYYAKADGALATGSVYVGGAGRRYFADAQYAAAAGVPVGSLQTGVIMTGGKPYYYERCNEISQGADHSVTLSGGLLKYGYFSVGDNAEDKKSYYSLPYGSTDAGVLQAGWVQIGGEWRYFDATGLYEEVPGEVSSDGWTSLSVNGTAKTYYRNASGKTLKGWQTIGGRRYYFDTDGSVYTGFRRIGSSAYYFKEGAEYPGELLTGLTSYLGHTYYANANGVLQLGWQRINGVWRYFDSSGGYELTDTSAVDACWREVSENGVAYRYYFKNGNTMVTGRQVIDGVTYYFNRDKSDGTYGRLMKGWFFVGKDKYYGDPDDGHLYSGLQRIGDFEYLFDSQYTLLTGWQQTPGASGVRYYDSSVSPESYDYGAARDDVTGCGNGYCKVSVNGAEYYYRFVNGTMQKGWQTIDGGRYCFGTDGRLQTGLFRYGNTLYYTADTGEPGELGRVVPGFMSYTADGVRRICYVNNAGAVQKGWQNISTDGVRYRYYFDEQAGMLTGWQVIDGRKYCFNTDDTAMPLGAMLTGEHIIDGHLYSFNTSGLLLTGWQKVGKRWFYYACAGDEAYGNGEGQLVYTDSEDAPTDHWRSVTFDGGTVRRYYITSNRTVAKKWQKIKGSDGITRRYYFDPYNGELQTGLSLIGNVWYRLHDTEGYVITGTEQIDGRVYMYDTTGRMLTGWHKSDGVWQYFSEDQEPGCLLYSDSTAAAGKHVGDWRIVTLTSGEEARFYIKADRILLKGWQNIKCTDGNTRRYYFDTSGMLRYGEDGILTLGGTVYRVQPESVSEEAYPGSVVSGFINEGTDSLPEWHYYDRNGKLLKGWQSIKGGDGVTRRYYLGTDGVLRTGVQDLNGSWYCFSEGEDTSESRIPGRLSNTYGMMLTGEISTGDGEYVANTKGILLGGWQKTSHGWRYYDKDDDVRGPVYTTSLDRIYPGQNWYRVTDDQSRIYYMDGDRRAATGFKNITDPDEKKSYRYYFEPDGVLAMSDESGLIHTGNGVYRAAGAVAGVPESGGRINTSGGTVTISGKTYYYDAGGRRLSGWVKVGAAYRYFAQADGSELPLSVSVDTAAGQYWAAVKEDGLLKIYYIRNNSTFLKGWQNIKDSDGTVRRYYFNADGSLETGNTDGTAVLQDGRGTGVNLLVSGRDYHIVMPLKEDDFVLNGDRTTGMVLTGFCTISGSRALPDGSYCFDRNGKRLTGWQNISQDGSSGRYYFGDSGAMVSGLRAIGGTRYLFGDDGRLMVGDRSSGIYSYGGGHYHTNAKGVIQTGWQKITGSDGVVRLYLFDESTGRLSYQPDTVPAADRKADVDVYTQSSGWIVAGTSRYYTDGSGIVTGWRNIEGAGGNKLRYYFLKPSGSLVTGDFRVGKNMYHAGGDGAILVNTWYDRRTSDDYTLRVREYYNRNGVRLTGWQSIKDTSGAAHRYYFDIEGRMALGVQAIGGKRYLFDTAEDQGMLLKNSYQTVGGSKYKTDKNGVILTGWQYYLSDGKYTWHYFDPDTGAEDEGRYSTSEKTKNGEWLETADGAVYYIEKGKIVTGWKKVDDRRYYFDPATGVMSRGFVQIDGKYHYFDEDGVAQTGKIRSGGAYYYLDKNSTVMTGWIKDSANTYYGNPASRIIPGRLCSGFASIGDQLYYFCEQTEEYDAACSLIKGFFTLPDIGQSYYDRRTGASNMYYAASSGEIHEPGWDVISLDSSDEYAQKWSYYFDPYSTGSTTAGVDIAGEVVTGEVTIDANGAVTHPADPVSAAAKQSDTYYRFDDRTGARLKAVLIFYGNYYGEADYTEDMSGNITSVTARFAQGQIDTFDSISRYINTDRAFKTLSNDVYVVNSNRISDQRKLYSAGLTRYAPSDTTFPMAASSQSKRKSERACYVSGNDIVKSDGSGQAGGYTGGRDGNVDVWDVEAYSYDVYLRALEKYGANNLVIMGCSSGGGICVGLVIKAAMNGQPRPSATVLLSPWVDAGMTNEDAVKLSGIGDVDVDTCRYWGARYTRAMDVLYTDDRMETDYNDCPGAGTAYYFASPLRSTEAAEYLCDLKNIVVYTGSNDPCYPDSRLLCDSINGAGGSAEFNLYKGAQHAYMLYPNRASYSAVADTVCGAAWEAMIQ